MICPTCKSDMIVVEHNKIELDYCTNCRGVWFDSGELELLLESAGLEGLEPLLANLAGSTEARSAEKKRKCPICLKKMKKIVAGQEPAIILDICRQGDGLWFDGGELAQLVGQMAGEAGEKTTPQQEIFAFLQEVFKTEG
ncbi:MAG: zf-TFIIB domain-containing protein [Deltaproteobacteria bacterium]|nr:zf-TFIIB domain-containing protein [Deltaproteobacteria bacterium]